MSAGPASVRRSGSLSSRSARLVSKGAVAVSVEARGGIFVSPEDSDFRPVVTAQMGPFRRISPNPPEKRVRADDSRVESPRIASGSGTAPRCPVRRLAGSRYADVADRAARQPGAFKARAYAGRMGRRASPFRPQWPGFIGCGPQQTGFAGTRPTWCRIREPAGPKRAHDRDEPAGPKRAHDRDEPAGPKRARGTETSPRDRNEPAGPK
jgi:hypothetical protein